MHWRLYRMRDNEPCPWRVTRHILWTQTHMHMLVIRFFFPHIHSEEFDEEMTVVLDEVLLWRRPAPSLSQWSCDLLTMPSVLLMAARDIVKCHYVSLPLSLSPSLSFSTFRKVSLSSNKNSCTFSATPFLTFLSFFLAHGIFNAEWNWE